MNSRLRWQYQLGDMPKQLIRHCPRCKARMGIAILDSVIRNVRAVHGFCMKCGYGFRWAIIRSSQEFIIGGYTPGNSTP